MPQRNPDKQIPLDLARKLAVKIAAEADPDRSAGCHLRTTHRDAAGYTSVRGPMSDGQRPFWLAHRVVMTAVLGAQIPEGMTVDHECEVRSCVNPEHLRLMPLAENILRSKRNPTAINARKTHCDHGHAFTAENTYVPRPGVRHCRTCARRRQSEYAARKRRTAA